MLTRRNLLAAIVGGGSTGVMDTNIKPPTKAVIANATPMKTNLVSRPSYPLNHAVALLSLYQEVALQLRPLKYPLEYEYAMVLLEAFDKAVQLLDMDDDDTGIDVEIKNMLLEGLNMNIGAIRQYRLCNTVAECV